MRSAVVVSLAVHGVPVLAFTPHELAQLNPHRHARAVFASYG